MVIETALLLSLASQCQSNVPPDVIQRLAITESSLRPFAIAVKGATVLKQPETKEQAIAAIQQLGILGLNHSVGLLQVNSSNFKRTGLTYQTAFNYCDNIRAGSEIFKECYDRASVKFKGQPKDHITNAAASCYYSGNFEYGFKKEEAYNSSYVERFNNAIPNPNVVEVLKPSPAKEPKPFIQVWDVFGDFSK